MTAAIDNVDLKKVLDFKSLIKYLRVHLKWPVDEQDADDLTFEYDPQELGIDEKTAVKIREIKQLRPLVDEQPWGIFWIDFEPKKLPVVIMRRILGALVTKKRGGADVHQATWNLNDLIFISAIGEGEDRGINFAHFQQEDVRLPTLRVLGWDGADTVLKLDHTDNLLKQYFCWPLDQDSLENWQRDWSLIFQHRIGHVIRTADALADRMAFLARQIRDACTTLLENETEKGPMKGLYNAFKVSLIHDLSPIDFADTYAQTITYGLLTAAISRTDLAGDEYSTALVAENVTDMVPITNPFLKELLQTFINVGGKDGKIDFDELGVQDVVELLRGDETDLPAILRDFGNKTQGEDPVIHFYEHFLSAYNKELKVQRGVFYTPKPVVSFIVRSVHELLQEEFGLEDGLADVTTWGEMEKRNTEIKCPEGTDADSPFVTILDPATGTATFLVEVIEVIYQTLTNKWKIQGLSLKEQKYAWNEYVPKYLLPRLHGYELMMAPYAIAHMKIGLKLHESGYNFKSEERANVYLTNALEEPSLMGEKTAADLFEALGRESQMVNLIKKYKKFTVIMGNPPYSVMSGNLTRNAKSIIDLYRYVDGKRIKERSMLRLEMHLQDDYVKFLALGQKILKKTEVGVLGYITNSGYLDNLTLRGVRFALINQFTKIAIVNLHGNRLRQNKALIESSDQNVFDIEQGVAIIIGITTKENKTQNKFEYSELIDTRINKYLVLNKEKISSLRKEFPSPKFENYFFVPWNDDLWPEYEKYISLSSAMPINISGIVTAHDKLVVDFDDAKLIENVNYMRDENLSDEEVRKLVSVKDNSGWKLSKVRGTLLSDKNDNKFLKNYSYRPFDNRRIYYHPQLVWSDRKRVMSHILQGNNIAIATCRQLAQKPWEHIFVTQYLQDDCYISNRTRERSYHFPLYLNNENANDLQPGFIETQKVFVANFSKEFISSFAFAQKLPVRNGLPKGISPEKIFHYIYAILYCPSYRERYSEYLKVDFPRIPITKNSNLFDVVSGLGEKLISLHLLEFSLKINEKLYEIGHGNNIIGKKYPIYENKEIHINEKQFFSGVSSVVWEYTIGSYQICNKWLKDRRGRELTHEDISHYQKILRAIEETIRIMDEIDEVIEQYGGWPIQ